MCSEDGSIARKKMIELMYMYYICVYIYIHTSIYISYIYICIQCMLTYSLSLYIYTYIVREGPTLRWISNPQILVFASWLGFLTWQMVLPAGKRNWHWRDVSAPRHTPRSHRPPPLWISRDCSPKLTSRKHACSKNAICQYACPLMLFWVELSLHAHRPPGHVIYKAQT